MGIGCGPVPMAKVYQLSPFISLRSYEETVKRKRKILEDFVISFLVDVRFQRC